MEEIIKLYEEYKKSKTWWYPEDRSFSSFMEWVEKKHPELLTNPLIEESAS